MILFPAHNGCAKVRKVFHNTRQTDKNSFGQLKISGYGIHTVTQGRRPGGTIWDKTEAGTARPAIRNAAAPQGIGHARNDAAQTEAGAGAGFSRHGIGVHLPGGLRGNRSREQRHQKQGQHPKPHRPQKIMQQIKIFLQSEDSKKVRTTKFRRRSNFRHTA